MHWGFLLLAPLGGRELMTEATGLAHLEDNDGRIVHYCLQVLTHTGNRKQIPPPKKWKKKTKFHLDDLQ